MTFDPKGTQPGLAGNAVTQPKVIHMKCRSDNCKSLRAVEISAQNSLENAGAAHNRMYRCVECNSTWGISTGGYVAF
jgi:hypothetical protein